VNELVSIVASYKTHHHPTPLHPRAGHVQSTSSSYQLPLRSRVCHSWGCVTIYIGDAAHGRTDCFIVHLLTHLFHSAAYKQLIQCMRVTCACPKSNIAICHNYSQIFHNLIQFPHEDTYSFLRGCSIIERVPELDNNVRRWIASHGELLTPMIRTHSFNLRQS
jgi:hypothetical protein